MNACDGFTGARRKAKKQNLKIDVQGLPGFKEQPEEPRISTNL